MTIRDAILLTIKQNMLAAVVLHDSVYINDRMQSKLIPAVNKAIGKSCTLQSKVCAAGKDAYHYHLHIQIKIEPTIIAVETALAAYESVKQAILTQYIAYDKINLLDNVDAKHIANYDSNMQTIHLYSGSLRVLAILNNLTLEAIDI